MDIQIGGLSLEFVLLFSSGLLIAAVLASRISSSFGVPALLVFLALGMLTGSEGLGKVPFEDYSLAYAIGSVGLAIILFDGGMRTPWSGVRPIFKVGLSLSVLATIITGVTTAAFAYFATGLNKLESMVLGAIVSSTDAAAVFSILRSKGLSLKDNLKELLEFEAGSNDPVAIFLTVAVLSVALGDASGPLGVIQLFFLQAGLGALGGWFGGRFMRWLINKSGVEFEGLYGVLVVGLVVLLFSAVALLGGSGFLAVYIAGMVLGNAEFLHKGSITRFLDGIAWVCQIAIFLVLGLLVFPSRLVDVWHEGLLIGLFMMFVGRPLSVLFAAPGRSLPPRERIFVSWIGLRGAAPIILATLPWSVGFPNSEKIFSLVFFIVFASVVFQGVSIPWFANFVGVTAPIKEEADNEKTGLLPPGFFAIEITVKEKAPACDHRVVDVGIPAGVLLTRLERDGRFLIPQGDTKLMSGDVIWALARQSNLEALRGLFGEVKLLQSP